jgi:hypothetical protein
MPASKSCLTKLSAGRQGSSSTPTSIPSQLSSLTWPYVHFLLLFFKYTLPLLTFSLRQSFLYIQLALSSLPLLIFAGFSISTILLALGTALSFILFWVGTALLILLPTLFVTISTGLGIWVWGVGSFLLARWLYNLIPVSVRGVAEVDMPNGKTVRVDKTGEGFGDVHARIEPKREHNLGAVSVPVSAPVVVANNY